VIYRKVGPPRKVADSWALTAGVKSASPRAVTITVSPADDALAPHPTPIGPTAVLERLGAEMAAHPLWECPFLRACRLGHLTRADWQYVFSQYYLYSVNFTRFLAAAMAGCPNDYYRARLAQNLWEEGGQVQPEERHPEIFRAFLREGLGVVPGDVQHEPFTEHYVRQVLDHCYAGGPAFVGAFLALGTEATVPRLYQMFREALLDAGIGEEHLRFFDLHIACDDAHAATLAEMMLSFSSEPGWEGQVRAGMSTALGLRQTFFDQLLEAIRCRRLASVVEGIQARAPLGSPRPAARDTFFACGSHGPLLYENRVEKLNVEFSVERVPFPAEVLDPRLVRIPPGRCNERHKHAHESIFFILAGEGRVHVGEVAVPARPGDLVFVPRWVLHQSENTGTDPLVILAVTDFGLTGRAFIGDYDRTARLKGGANRRRAEGG
jgi:mannose-6-phosphate isomerase-like protein (cupin superfamily)/pyrroloquinoline quinone (PQQ) biosynthesis protein C